MRLATDFMLISSISVVLLSACGSTHEEDIKQELSYIRSALDKFTTKNDFGGAMADIEAIDSIHSRRARSKEPSDSCDMWVSPIVYNIDKIESYLLWKRDPSMGSATSVMNDDLNDRRFAGLGEDNYEVKESRKCDDRFPGLTDTRKKVEAIVASSRPLWLLDIKVTMGEQQYKEAVRVFDADRNYTQSIMTDRYSSWEHLSEDQRGSISGDDPEVRACMDKVMENARLTSGTSKTDMAETCKKFLAR